VKISESYHGVENGARTISSTVRNRETAVIKRYEIDLLYVLF
jgi:hypothetical protein